MEIQNLDRARSLGAKESWEIRQQACIVMEMLEHQSK